MSTPGYRDDDAIAESTAGVHVRVHRRIRRARRRAWGGAGFAVLAGIAITAGAAFHPIGSITDPDGNGRVYLLVNCFTPAGDPVRPSTYRDANDDAGTQAGRLDPAGVCTQMAQDAVVNQQLVDLNTRPDVAAAGSAVIYATDGSVWQLEKDVKDAGNGHDPWSLVGGPDPIMPIGVPHPTALPPYTPQNVAPNAVIIRGFAIDIPPAQPQAVCAKNDVEFDVYAMTAGQTAQQVCATHDLIAQN